METILPKIGPGSQRRMIWKLGIIGSLFFLSTATVFPESSSGANGSKTIADLRQQIEKILVDTHTPGAGIALVGREGPIWVDGVGLADVPQNRPATGETLFPVGSISKMFVALAALKLQQEGRLHLQDTLRSRAPEVAFDNPWETTHPIRIVHLLEHTTGWNDNAPREGKWNPIPEPTRLEGLAYHPRSRTSRWQPGTCFSYSNLGPDVAAYVIEKVTGEKFEDYVARTWFKPLGMTGASYFETPEVRAKLATGYGQEGATKHPHFNILTRPAGSVAASPRDMANFLEFFLTRGSFRGIERLPKEAIDRMERPASTYAAAEGLETGYGLCNSATVGKRSVYHGHGGTVPGACAHFTYLPDEKLGCAVMINCENEDAINRVESAVWSYLRQDQTPGPIPPARNVDEAQPAGYEGWYEMVTPRNERARYLERILGLTHVTSENGQLLLKQLAWTSAYVRVTGRLYRKSEQVAPTLALIGNRSEGAFIQFGGGRTLRRMPMPVVALIFAFMLATAFLMVSSAIFAFVWLPKMFFGKLKDEPFLGVRIDPLLATLFSGALFVLIWAISGDPFARAGGPVWSGTWAMIVYYLAHGVFAFFAIRGLFRALRRRLEPIRRLVWWHSFATSLVLSAWAVYLSYWGLRSSVS